MSYTSRIKLLMYICITAALIAGCGSGKPDPAPAISSFSATPSIISKGQTVTITPSFTGGIGRILSFANNSTVSRFTFGNVTSVRPSFDTRYTLTVTNRLGATVSETTSVTLSPIQGRFTSSHGPTLEARDNHTATLLPSGKVLLAGGSMHDGAFHYRKNAELYDPVAGTSTATGFMMYSSASHTATLLPSGKVLLTGGWDGFKAHREAQLFDPAANGGAGGFSFTGSMNSVRVLHTATLLGNGKVLITGGYDGSATLSSAELYDPGTGTFTPTGSMAVARKSHTATLLNNGKVLIAGGTPDNTLCELYDPATGLFTATGRLNYARSNHTATLLSNGPNANVLIAGGGSALFAELYDPVTGTFSLTSPMTVTRTFLTATLLSDTRVLLAGGSGDNTAEFYDPATRTFAGPVVLSPPAVVKPLPLLLMNEVRSSHTATMLPDGQVFFAGGTGFNNKPELFE